MARAKVADRIKQRQLNTKGPVRRLFEAGVRAYEDVRGLNIGGAESGRNARAAAVTKYLKTNTRNPSTADLGQIAGIGYNIRHPEAENTLDEASVLAGTRERKVKKGK